MSLDFASYWPQDDLGTIEPPKTWTNTLLLVGAVFAVAFFAGGVWTHTAPSRERVRSARAAARRR